ncbi:MAG TPA: hypothetical protein VK601_05200, partial [Kofleriaceae bacterium]|nr:hypothetical protein [Kofleriaceae bacterium]
MLYDLQKQAGGGDKLVGGALVVSVNEGYVDPALVWVLKDLGWLVMPATGGGVRGTAGNILGSAQNIDLIEVMVGGKLYTGLVGPTRGGLEPREYLSQRAVAAMAQLDQEIVVLHQRQIRAKTTQERESFAQQVRDKTEQRLRIDTRFKAYLADVSAETGRGPTDRTRPSVAPAANQPPPAIAAAAALRAELAPFTQLVVGGDSPRFADEALVVIGQPELAQMTQETRDLIATQQRIASMQENLRWSTPAADRQPLIDVLETYRAQLRAAAERTTHAGSKELLLREAGIVDADLTTLTGRSAADLEAIRQAAALAKQADKNVAKPAEVGSLAVLGDGKKANEIIEQNDGYVLAGGKLYRLKSGGQGEGFTISMVRLAPAFAPSTAETAPSSTPPALPAGVPQAPPPAKQGPTTVLAKPEPIVVSGPVPEGFAEMPNVINVSGRTIVLSETGQSLPPTPSEPLANAKPGELIVRGFSGGYFVTDPLTGRPIAAAMTGGEWWQVQKDGTFTLLVDSTGNVQEAGAVYRFETEPLETAEFGRPVGTAERPTSSYSGGTRAVAGAMSIIAVANDIMGPINQTLDIQRHNIAMGQGQIAFWTQFGADPSVDMRTQNSDESKSKSAPETAAAYGEPIYPRVTGINKEKLKATLEASIRTHAQLMTWLFLGRIVEALEIDPDLDVPTAKRDRKRTYAAITVGPPGSRIWPRIDITDIIEPIEKRTLGALESSM